ncbi:MAG: TIGR00730 family Rossman fold protein [Litorilinea sp.]
MLEFSALCVFCGANGGKNHRYLQAATELGTSLGARGIDLVYGGGSVGMMGAVAQAAQAHGSRVTGVIPASLTTKELMGAPIGELIVVDTMHERKAKMAALAQGFIGLPGGFGTLEELFESITWGQLGIHQKPIGLLNVEGYFDSLIRFIDHGVAEGFIRAEHRNLLCVAATADALLAAMADYTPPPGLVRWLQIDET